MNQPLKNEKQLVFCASVLTILFYLKYFLQGWSGKNDEIVENISYLILLFGLLFSGVAFLIATNKEKIFFLVLLFLFISAVSLYGNKYYFWCISAYPLMIFYSRLSDNKVISVLLISLMSAWLLFIPFQLIFSEGFFFNDDRYIRLSLGFDNPNTFAVLLFVLYSLLLAFYDRLVGGLDFLFYILTSFLMLPLVYLTMSRTFFFSCLLLFLYFPIRRISFLKVGNKVATMSLIAIACFQFYLVDGYGSNNSLSVLLDSFLSGRVRMSYQMYSSLGLPGIFFGEEISDYLPIDFFFPNLLFSSGLVFSFCYIAFYVYVLSSLKSKTNFISFLCLVMILLSMAENVFNIPIINYTIFILYKNKMPQRSVY